MNDKKLRLVETSSQQKLARVSPIEAIEIAENVLKEGSGALSGKLATLTFLVDLYMGCGYRSAAIDACKKAEAIFLQLIEWSEEKIDINHIQFHLNSYLITGCYADARRVADKAASIMTRKLKNQSPLGRKSFYIWASKRLYAHIELYERVNEIRTEEMRTFDVGTLEDKKEVFGLSMSLNAYDEVTNCVMNS